MPYIDKDRRNELVQVKTKSQKQFAMSRADLGDCVAAACENGGDLQYILAVAMQGYLEIHGLRYQQCQDLMGALSGALTEFKRCVVSPYEEIKIADNGGVYNLDAMQNNGY
jgi:hypothetical protein